MKTVLIGDLHGRKVWQDIVNIEGLNNGTEYVFLGDYFDSFTISRLDQIDNFNNLLEFKKSYPLKVTLLIGNHDYYEPLGLKFSGFSSSFYISVKHQILDLVRRGDLTIFYNQGKFLVSHAGISVSFCVNNDIDPKNLLQDLKNTWKYKPQTFAFQHSKDGRRASAEGENIYQSPIWIRPDSLEKDYVSGFTQIIGHTEVDFVEEHKFGYNIDCLPREYGVIENDEFRVKFL